MNIIELAKEAGFIPNGQHERAWLERFAALVRAEYEKPLKLAEEALMVATTPLATDRQTVLKAQAAIREALADAFAAPDKPIDHVANADKMIRCAYCDNPLFAGTKCNNCGRVTLAEPVKQEPVVHYKDAPHTIYLQTGCEDPEFCECSFNEWGDTTWCKDQIHDTDIPYIRADYAAPVDAKAIRAASEALQCAEARLEELGEDALVGKCAAAIRAIGETK